ncbi:COG5437 Predicted secreted protein [uncultured Caudovirales phage]|uniref:COG5437 Predicted secreted protein n=1 Tax=uncultured Caudovirales phage TaxID=2100421 RepID=A0A6J5NIJ5_9CAUD|nr:COG5437 Predicted secreted protein [uncultured Caudovirales phage]
MAGANGRQLIIEWGTGATPPVLVGIRTRGYTVTNDYVDVTTDDDGGWRTLLAAPGLRSMEVTVGGISSDQVLIADAIASTVTAKTLQVEFPLTTGNLSGLFLCSSFEQTGEHDGAVEFTATFMSAGVVTYTAGSPG